MANRERDADNLSREIITRDANKDMAGSGYFCRIRIRILKKKNQIIFLSGSGVHIQIQHPSEFELFFQYQSNEDEIKF